jgi:RNA polymerase sigma-70 factor (ECF subfamily)
MWETSKDKSLIEKYLKGDEKALEVLVGKYIKPIYSYVYRNVGDQALAEDATQEIFIKVWKNIKKFDLKKNFKPWLFQIAKNTSIDYLRKRKTIPFSKFEDERGHNVLLENIIAAPMNLIESLSDKRVLAAALQRLDKKEQQIIYFRYNDGLSFQEIADIFKESINTIKSRYRRALLNMKKGIKSY